MINFLQTTDSLTPDEHAKATRFIDKEDPDSHIWGEWMMRFFLPRA